MMTEQRLVSEKEWVELLTEAKNLGLTPEEVRSFLFSKEPAAAH
ncbi:anti-repressor SinI family protein [Metabacillus sp. 84]